MISFIRSLYISFGLNMFLSLKFQRNLELDPRQNFWPI